MKTTTGVTRERFRIRKGGRVVKYRIRVVSIGIPTSSQAVRDEQPCERQSVEPRLKERGDRKPRRTFPASCRLEIEISRIHFSPRESHCSFAVTLSSMTGPDSKRGKGLEDLDRAGEAKTKGSAMTLVESRQAFGNSQTSSATRLWS